ncbi:hypothetical protein EST38_g6556 [Candolleomyces aberdarensis]|uniref:Nephrocystin 3-like N-terminal domain-containing protein n=1 Tax=Candolleomyces aberdarensis TaxID=2316362 RepID=A0A4Q2DKP4_9AGAR|nr:hypothetical protein EST38_g6556 [Candolleomyces aberdarensis]
MSSVSYFKNAKHFVANPTFNTYVSEGDALQYLHKHCATSAIHDSEERYPPPLCHEGTREVVIGRIEGWYGFEIPPEKKIMWVHAPAGYGKTAVAGTVSKKLESREDLDFNPVGATFFFWRTSPERNSPARLIVTLAYQLAMSIPELLPRIEAAVKRNPMVLNKALEVQLVKFIIEPFRLLGGLADMPHRLVIIDGLDECINSDQETRFEKQYAEDQERAQVRVLDLIHTLVSHHLPLCFLILSRPEPWIKRHMESKSFQAITEALDLYQVGDHLNDVEKFVRAELARIAEMRESPTQPGESDEEWPGEDRVQQLMSRTGGHILYASTVIRHIDDPYGDPCQRLDELFESPSISAPGLQSASFTSLHELYRQIMRSCPLENRETMIQVLEDVMASEHHFDLDIGVRRALTILDRVSGRAPGRGVKAVRCLHAVMRLRDVVDGDPESDSLMFFYHSSFVEFLLNPKVSLEFTVGVQRGTRRLLLGCFDSLSSMALDSKVDEEHFPFVLTRWAMLWNRWTPSDEAEYLSQLRAMLALDLKACFVRECTPTGFQSSHRHGTSLHCCCRAYHPLNNIILQRKPYLADEPLVGQTISYVQSSVEEAFFLLLDPAHYSVGHDRTLPASEKLMGLALGTFLEEIYQHRPHAFNKVLQALKKLRLEQADLYERLEQDILYWLIDDNHRLRVEKILKLVRQDDQ